MLTAVSLVRVQQGELESLQIEMFAGFFVSLKLYLSAGLTWTPFI